MTAPGPLRFALPLLGACALALAAPAASAAPCVGHLCLDPNAAPPCIGVPCLSATEPGCKPIQFTGSQPDPADPTTITGLVEINLNCLGGAGTP